MQPRKYDNVAYYDTSTHNIEAGHVEQVTDAYADVFTAHAGEVRVILSDIQAIADTEARATACRDGIRRHYGYPEEAGR